MDNRALVWLTSIAVACVLLLLMINAMPLFFTTQGGEKYLKYNDIKGIEVEYKGKPYTLNFKQQTDFVGHVNKSIVVKPDAIKEGIKPDISKIVIYRFNEPELVLKPITYDPQNNLIFSNENLSKDGVLKDTSQGSLKDLISKSYDH